MLVACIWTTVSALPTLRVEFLIMLALSCHSSCVLGSVAEALSCFCPSGPLTPSPALLHLLSQPLPVFSPILLSCALLFYPPPFPVLYDALHHLLYLPILIDPTPPHPSPPLPSPPLPSPCVLVTPLHCLVWPIQDGICACVHLLHMNHKGLLCLLPQEAPCT